MQGHESASGNFRSATDDDLNSDTGMAEHGDQGVDTEAVDLASDKVADPWLGQLIAEKAAGDLLGEDDRVQGQEFDYAATTTDIAPCFLRVGVILTSTL